MVYFNSSSVFCRPILATSAASYSNSVEILYRWTNALLQLQPHFQTGDGEVGAIGHWSGNKDVGGGE